MQKIGEFVEAVTTAMGLSLKATVEETPDGVLVALEGEGGEMLTRRRGEALNALQHLVGSVFRDAVPQGQRIAVDCQGFRRDKDADQEDEHVDDDCGCCTKGNAEQSENKSQPSALTLPDKFNEAQERKYDEPRAEEGDTNEPVPFTEQENSCGKY